MLSCKRGSILRKAYVRHGKSKTIRVRSGCIKAQSQSGRKRITMDLAKMTKRRKVHSAMRKKYGTPHCKPGQIIREGYTYTRKSAFKRQTVNTIQVAPGCIKATGLSIKRGTKGKQLFVLDKGTLTQFGYHTALRDDQRQATLKKALQQIKPLSVYRKLNALYVLNKNKNPALALLYRSDADFVKTTAEYKKSSRDF